MTKKTTEKKKLNDRKSKTIVEPTTVSNKKKYIFLSFILLLTVLIYSNSFRNQFVNYDDDDYINRNDNIKTLTSKNISKIFTTYYFSNYHPITTLSYAVDYHYAFNKSTGNINPFRFHLINLIFHLFNVILVFQLMYLLIKKLNLSAIAALIFAIHPMHVESVSWISERKDVLYAFFFLLSAISYIYYLRNGRKIKFMIFCFVGFCFSLLSKSMAVTLPVLLLLFDYFENHKITLKNCIEKIPFFILSIVFGIMAILSQNQGGSISNLGQSFSIINQFFLVCYGIIFYIVKFFAPFHLSVLHPYPELVGGTLPFVYYLSGILVLAIIISLFLISFKFKKEILFGFFFFLITISVVLQIFPVGQAMVAERYTYIPYLGFIFIVIQLVNYLNENRLPLYNKLKPFALVLLSIYILAFSYSTFNRNEVWKNSISLWSDMIQKYPRNYYGYYSLGNAYSEKNMQQEAVKKYDRSIELFSKYADSYYSRGTVKYKLTDYKGAIDDFTLAIQLNPKYQEAYSNRGTAKLQLQDFINAKLDFDKAIEINPKDASEYYNRGNVEYYMQNDSLALQDLNKAITLKPLYPEAYVNRGLVYYYMKNLNAACNDWNQALQMGQKEASNYLDKFCK